MNMLTKLAAKMLAVFSIITLAAVPLAASPLNSSDMDRAFGGSSSAVAAPVQSADAGAPRAMSKSEMQDTQGAIAPVIVYGLAVGGRIAYVGITNNLARRTAQHAATRTFDSVVRIGSSQTRTGARIIEQNNINRLNTINNGMNRINSISPRNPLSNRVSVPYRR